MMIYFHVIWKNEYLMKDKNRQHVKEILHQDLLEVQKTVYAPCGLISSPCIAEAESREYGAFDFELNHRPIKSCS